MTPLLGGRRDPRASLPRHFEAILGLAARLRGDLLGGVVRALEDPGDLLADALERAAHGRLGRPRGLQLGDELAGPLDVGVDRDPVVAAQDDREVDVGSDPAPGRRGASPAAR